MVQIYKTRSTEKVLERVFDRKNKITARLIGKIAQAVGVISIRGVEQVANPQAVAKFSPIETCA